MTIAWENNNFAKYTCEKASIALNGISLTIAKINKEGNVFSIAVIPHTWENTTLKYLEEGAAINLESDLMAKYAESILLKTTNQKNLLYDTSNKNTNISLEWLRNNGFS